jgi:regulation of enolase protein 1 (concanavalin A-like superfamily)
MNRSIFILVFGVLSLNICECDSAEPQRKDPLVDSNDANEVQNLLSNAYLFEDFNDTFFLNWNILGDDPSHWSLDMVPGTLTITTQDGSFTRYRTDYKNIFLISVPVVQSVDFQVTTCVTNFKPYGFWNQAGLILWIDEDNNFKLVYEYGEGPPPNNAPKLLFTAARETNGYVIHGWFETEQYPQNMWLRIIKRGDLYELFNSIDGESFKPMTVILPARLTDDNTVPCLDDPLEDIGVFADNGTSWGAPEVDASFDFFEFKVLPKEETDGNVEEMLY